MSDHLGEQLIAAVNLALVGLTTTGNNIFRDYPDDRTLPTTQLPAILLLLGPEDVEITSLEAVHTQRRQQQIRLVLLGCAHTHWPVLSVYQVLNQIHKEVEIALSGGVTIAGKVLLPIYLGMTEPERDSTGDEPIARAEMNYLFEYFTLSNAPDAFA